MLARGKIGTGYGSKIDKNAGKVTGPTQRSDWRTPMLDLSALLSEISRTKPSRQPLVFKIRWFPVRKGDSPLTKEIHQRGSLEEALFLWIREGLYRGNDESIQ